MNIKLQNITKKIQICIGMDEKKNKFKKSIEWKVVPYDHKYFKL